MYLSLIIFLIINFLALLVGSFFTAKGVPSSWYKNLNKAPWTPPGWFFGVAWTSIMICFALYMMYGWEVISNKKFLIILFGIQWILNVSWNPLFFKFHKILGGLVVIILLTLVVGYFLLKYSFILQLKSLFILPYLIWLLVATSLNGYVYLKN